VSVRPAVFLDRDGILNELVPDVVTGHPESPVREGDVRLMPGVAAMVHELQAAGFAVVCVTNQPAAAKGLVELSRLKAVHRHVVDLLAAAGGELDGWGICYHHPDAVVEELRGPCGCRKPADGMLRDAAADLTLDLERSWMIGDTDADVLAGRAAGCRTVLVANPASAHKRTGSVMADVLVETMSKAVRAVLDTARGDHKEASGVA
jgi:histidinol-phosphate phosphatase family protein